MSYTKFEKIGNKLISEDFTVEKQGNRYYKGEDTLAEIIGNHINIDLSLIGGGSASDGNIICGSLSNVDETVFNLRANTSLIDVSHSTTFEFINDTDIKCINSGSYDVIILTTSKSTNKASYELRVNNEAVDTFESGVVGDELNIHISNITVNTDDIINVYKGYSGNSYPVLVIIQKSGE